VDAGCIRLIAGGDHVESTGRRTSSCCSARRPRGAGSWSATFASRQTRDRQLPVSAKIERRTVRLTVAGAKRDENPDDGIDAVGSSPGWGSMDGG
jgi:hypothetical protein